MASIPGSGGTCPKAYDCCGGGENPLYCCDPSICQECVGGVCVFVYDNKPSPSACSYDCECASGSCTANTCD